MRNRALASPVNGADEALLSELLLKMETLNGEQTSSTARGLIAVDERIRQEIAGREDLIAELERRFAALQTVDHILFPSCHLPSILGYEMGRELGAGGTAIVFLARQLALDRDVAIKLMTGGRFAGRRALARFRNEARILAKLKHDNIVQVFDSGECEGSPYLVLEFVEGGSLKQRLAGHPLDPRTAAQLVETLALAIQHAHLQNIVHRDLKTSNVLITRDDKPKIADFGLVKLMDGDAGLTETGDMPGTPSYMAPEQANGGEVGPWTDVYALGAVLYEALTGRPPFVGETTTAVLQEVRTRDPVPPCRVQRGVPADLQAICLKCLEKQPKSRYFSGAELAADLSRFLDGKTTIARPKNVVLHLAQWIRGHPAAAALLAITLTAISALLTGSIVHNRTLSIALQTSERHRLRAERQEEVTKQQGHQLRQRLYASDMQTASEAWRNGTVQDLLARLAPYAEPNSHGDLRGFEWYFLRRQCHLESSSVRAHDDLVTYITYSPDGNLMATASDDGTVKIWRENGQLVETMKGHASCVNEVQFVPSRNWLVTASCDHTIKIWDATTYEELLTLGDHEAPVSCLAIHPDTQTIVAGLTDSDPIHKPVGGAVVIWDVRSRSVKNVLTNVQSNVHDLELSNDGHTLFVACGHQIRLFNTGSGQEVREFKRRHYGEVMSLAVSTDGTEMLSAAQEGLAVRWDVATGEPLQIMRNPGSLTCVRYLDESRMVTTSRNRNLYIWDAKSGALERKILAHDADVSNVAVKRGSNTTFSTGSWDGEIKRWDNFYPFERSWKGSHREYLHCAFDPELRYAIIIDSEAHVRRIALMAPHGDGFGPRPTAVRMPASAIVSDCGEFCAGYGQPNTLEIRRLEDWRLISKRSDVEGKLIGFTYDSRQLITATEQSLTEWELADLTPRRLATLPAKWNLTAAAAHPRKRMFAICGGDGTLAEFDLAMTQLPPRTSPDCGYIGDAAYSPDGELLAVSGGGNIVFILEHATLGIKHRLVGHSEAAICVAFSKDGKTLASGGKDGTIRLWHVATGTELLAISGLPLLIDEIAFSNDGQRLAAFMDKAEIRVWDIADRIAITER